MQKVQDGMDSFHMKIGEYRWVLSTIVRPSIISLFCPFFLFDTFIYFDLRRDSWYFYLSTKVTHSSSGRNRLLAAGPFAIILYLPLSRA